MLLPLLVLLPATVMLVTISIYFNNLLLNAKSVIGKVSGIHNLILDDKADLAYIRHSWGKGVSVKFSQ